MRKFLYIFILVVLFSILGIHHILPDTISVNNIYIPDSIGTIEDTYHGRSDKTVVFIKDAHAFSQAQFNIAEIIQRLALHNGITLIGVEGAVGPLNTNVFRGVPFKQARNLVASDYLKKGIFSGAEYAAIVNKIPISLFGTEDKNLFLSNYNTFLHSSDQKDQIVLSFIPLNTVLDDLKTYIFSNKLKTFDQYISYYETGKLGLELFVSILYKNAKSYHIDLNKYPNLAKLKESLKLRKKINFDTTKYEQDKIRMDITSQIRALALDRNTKTQLLNIISRKQTELSAPEFARFMLDIAQQIGTISSSYQQLNAFARYGANTRQINFADLSREITELGYKIRIAMSADEREKKLVEYDYYISRLKNILSLESVRTEAQVFINDKKQSWLKCIQFLQDQTAGYNITFDQTGLSVIENAMNTAYKFYREAIERDRSFVDNLLARMNSGESAVLIAGGFHESGITRILRERSISYVAIKPFISSSVPDIAYLDKMRGDLFPVEPANNSKITVSLLYTELFSNYPKLADVFTRQTARKTIDMILNGQTSVESIVYHIYDDYELPLPSASYTRQITDQLQPALDNLRAVAKSSGSTAEGIAVYLEKRIMESVQKAKENGLNPPDENLKVSVVIPVYNEFRNGNIFDQLESFVKQSADPKSFELVFVVNNSVDDALRHTQGFRDNQLLLEMGAYINSPSGVGEPSFFHTLSAHQRRIISAVKEKGLSLHFIDCSTQGLPGIVEKQGVRIGTIRNIGIYTSISRFESLGRDGFIANLDADTTVPSDYIAKLTQYSKQDDIEVVYTNMKYDYAGGDEFLFETHFVESAMRLSARFPEYLLAKAPPDVGTVRIIARASLFKSRGGFPDLTTGEDFVFTRLLNRSSNGIVSAPDISVTAKDRMREKRGFESDIRYQLGQSMSADEFSAKYALTPHTSIKMEFLKRELRGDKTKPTNLEQLNTILNFYGFSVPPYHPAIETFLQTGSTYQLITFLETSNNPFNLSNIDSNIDEFIGTVLRNISVREYDLFLLQLNNAIERENKDISKFQKEFRQIYDTVWDHPDKESITRNQIRQIISDKATHPTLLILANEDWFVKKLQDIGQQSFRETYYNKLAIQFRDWLNPIDDYKRNIFRKGIVYLRVLNKFIQQAMHLPESLPEFHAYLTKITGNDYLTLSESELTTDTPQPHLQQKRLFTTNRILDSSL